MGLLLIHISTALFSLVMASVAVVVPSRPKLHLAYGLTAATLVSGSYLAYSSHAPLVQACMSGLVYLVIALSLSIAAHVRLVRQTASA
jgi:hypothetical protein